VRTDLAVLSLALGLVLSGLPLAAHHSFAAEYDAKQPITLKGKITKLEWTNPHAHFYLDVAGPDGKVANWNLELASPNMMVRNGWKRSFLQEGAEVTVNASRAKDGTNTASVQTITLADGRKLGFINANVDGK
jgi:hypothetical protein